MILSQQRKVLAEGNVKNVEIQGEIRPRVHCGKKKRSRRLWELEFTDGGSGQCH